MNTPSTQELVSISTFIFLGTVGQLNRSSLRAVLDRPGLAIVKFERGFRVNPMLGGLVGRPITVQLAKGGEVRAGQKLIFFANSWVHAEEIAVTELAHVPANEKSEKEVSEAISALPTQQLQERLASAILVVLGTVLEIEPAGVFEPISEHAPGWMRATVEVRDTLKGDAAAPKGRGSAQKKGHTTFLFPESTDTVWRRYPKLKTGEEAIFLVHASTVAGLPSATPILGDLADVQPANALANVRTLLTRATRAP